MELEVRHLKVLCAIADAGSLHAAARSLGTSQPALTTQLRRIENMLGGRLFSRERTGCVPTALGQNVVGRARPLLASLGTLVAETRAAAARAAQGGRLRIGSTASRAIPGWLRRLRERLPATETELQVAVSASALLRRVADGELDVAFVHEVEGCPLRVPPGLDIRTLVEREPQFVCLAVDHPAAHQQVVDLTDLAADQWMIDPSVDGEWEGLRRVLNAAGLNPRVLHGDYLTAAGLVATGEVVTLCQPSSLPRADMVVRPLRGDPLGVRLFLAVRSGAYAGELAGVGADLAAAYWEAAALSPPYRAWLRERGGRA
ncbi:LysR family transcriptional regulator [Streptomyces sp. NPDC048111]|uniref:LysR family transcriptional regulator n=1 Tax=Streptomyces sp. NPDC048111 TaxID=3365500 RepID=UPI00371E531D